MTTSSTIRHRYLVTDPGYLLPDVIKIIGEQPDPVRSVEQCHRLNRYFTDLDPDMLFLITLTWTGTQDNHLKLLDPACKLSGNSFCSDSRRIIVLELTPEFLKQYYLQTDPNNELQNIEGLIHHGLGQIVSSPYDHHTLIVGQSVPDLTIMTIKITDENRNVLVQCDLPYVSNYERRII